MFTKTGLILPWITLKTKVTHNNYAFLEVGERKEIIYMRYTLDIVVLWHVCIKGMWFLARKGTKEIMLRYVYVHQ